jgi:uncharacterized paraquat-inducible protein A
MSTVTDLHFVCSLFIFAAAVIPIYLSVMLKGNLRKLTIMLSIFVMIHSAYHVAGTLGIDFLSEQVFEPLSIVALIFFGLFYLKLAKETKQMVRND